MGMISDFYMQNLYEKEMNRALERKVWIDENFGGEIVSTRYCPECKVKTRHRWDDLKWTCKECEERYYERKD